jgi:EAL domain-containing protein (putative c-di-GMP-specific phosphodiesterase class I)
MRDEQQARDVLLKLQSLSVQLDVDDLGGGRSVPGRLHDVSMDGLKLDHDFVRDLTKRPEHATIVKSVVALARSLNIPLVAEGVETPEEGRLLESLGCGFAQGYLYAEPMTADAATQLLRTERPPVAPPAAA